MTKETNEKKLLKSNIFLYELLELYKLDFSQRRIFNKCLDIIDISETFLNNEIIKTEIENLPSDKWHSEELKDFFSTIQDYIRIQWHTLILSLFNDKKEEELKTRLGLIQKLVILSQRAKTL